MIATGNHGYFDSLRDAPPRRALTGSSGIILLNRHWPHRIQHIRYRYCVGGVMTPPYGNSPTNDHLHFYHITGKRSY
jgi:hypothetical protein